ncbi:3'-5' exonuclease [Photobacterium sp. ZSDE20]|uniref:3'-5' exonuclease n=1 Tax=Photobacterium pectinilyticum TaxID=2906793 RepID=A0ABT1N498_9GAMM|nr:3'-5' exonuclease [Photobacterium sp. ZSDE20]MCQ1059563.1 3'-5' exonuclease [Photobacterium sp. ZSDE20]MDD1825426.1 3'-5' exonuclease [Photobacterium sp. ZSDE20]
MKILILDTETTGLDGSAEIVEIGIIDMSGNVIFDSLIKPQSSIPSEATGIHGITNADVATSPIWPEVHNQVCSLLDNAIVHIYNAQFDVRIINQTIRRYGLSEPKYTAECVMLRYAKEYNEWNAFRGNYAWQKLTNAAHQQNIEINDLTAHRAVSDCEITRRLLLKLNAGDIKQCT